MSIDFRNADKVSRNKFPDINPSDFEKYKEVLIQIVNYFTVNNISHELFNHKIAHEFELLDTDECDRLPFTNTPGYNIEGDELREAVTSVSLKLGFDPEQMFDSIKKYFFTIRDFEGSQVKYALIVNDSFVNG